MYVDSRSLEDGTVIDADICIVGAGAAGITLARELANRPYRVCLVESGGFEFDPDTQALHDAINIGRPYPKLPVSRLRYFGGTTNHWGGYCLPFLPENFESRPWIPNSGWPLSRNELNPYYARAHQVLNLGEFDYDADETASELAHDTFPFDPSRVETVVSRINPVRFGEVYRDELDRADNVITYLWGNLTNINRHPDDPYIADIDVKTLSGVSWKVKSKYYVLALGGIENARMLLLSNDLEPSGIGNMHDLVGRYFMEHIWHPSGCVLPAEQNSRMEFYITEHPRPGGYAARGHVALPPEVARRLEIPLYRCELEFTNACVEKSEAVYSARVLRNSLTDFSVPEDLGGHLFNVIAGIGDLTDYMAGSHPSGYHISSYTEQVPNPASRVGLAHERDALGLNRATVDWRLSELDRTGIHKAVEAIAVEVGRSGFGRVHINLDEDEATLLEGANGGAHHMGTTRMDEDSKRGVVDSNCRVHGLHNLFVAGSSVFPTGGYAHPTLTIVAMTIRLGDHLKSLMAS